MDGHGRPFLLQRMSKRDLGCGRVAEAASRPWVRLKTMPAFGAAVGLWRLSATKKKRNGEKSQSFLPRHLKGRGPIVDPQIGRTSLK